jgi:hypothetical protein
MRHHGLFWKPPVLYQNVMFRQYNTGNALPDLAFIAYLDIKKQQHHAAHP